MNYQRLFSLNLFHDYYRDRACADFKIEPTQACQRSIQGHRLILKDLENGILTLAPLDATDQPFVPLVKPLSFTFLLKLNNPEFTSFTQFETDYSAVDNFYCFSNDSLKSSDETPATLELPRTLVKHSALRRSAAEQSALEQRLAQMIELKTAQRKSIFGIVEIQINESLSALPPQFQKFTLTFPAKKQYWNYYLVTEQGTSSDFSLQDKTARIAFTQMETDPADRLLLAIAHQFPNSQPQRFQSQEPVTCQEAGENNIQLFKNGQTKPWLQHLPNPPNQSGTQVVNLLKDV